MNPLVRLLWCEPSEFQQPYGAGGLQFEMFVLPTSVAPSFLYTGFNDFDSYSHTWVAG